MKFERVNLGLDNKEQKAEAKVETIQEAPEVKEEVKVEEPVAAPAPTEQVEVKEEAKEEVIEEVKTEAKKSDLDERFAIPEFESTILTQKPKEETVKDSVTLQAEDIKGIEATNEIPEDAEVHEEAIIEGSNEDVDRILEEVAAPTEEPEKEEEILTQSVTTVDSEQTEDLEASQEVSKEAADEIREEVEKIKTEHEEPTKDECWIKFVDNVIIPTLVECLDKTKDFITEVIARDLKKSNPDVD